MRYCFAALLLLLFAPFAFAQDAPSDADLIARAEALAEALFAGDIETLSADFNAQMRAALPPERLATLGPTLDAQLGAPQEQVGARVETQQPGARTVILTQRFERATADILVTFDAAGQVAGLFVRPVEPGSAETEAGGSAEASPLPPYADPETYRAEEVTVDAGVGLPLGGTLLVPDADRRVPGVVLVHGSGPSDRDGTQGPNKPLRDLAVGFASEGVAALRFEKRTRAYPDAFAEGTYTVAEESMDAALDVLRQHPDVDSERLFIVGHSLGGAIAPRIARLAAERGTPVAGIVILAGGARPLDVILEDQLDYLDEVAPENRERRTAFRDAVARVRALTPADSASTEAVVGAPPAYWLDLKNHPPAPIAADLDASVLVVHAGRDYNVPDADFAVWREGLRERAGVTGFRRYPALNHLLFAGEGPSTPAEYQQQGFVDATLVEETADWVRNPGTH